MNRYKVAQETAPVARSGREKREARFRDGNGDGDVIETSDRRDEDRKIGEGCLDIEDEGGGMGKGNGIKRSGKWFECGKKLRSWRNDIN